jgi:fructose-1,6-bisphosphatase II
MFNPGPCVYMEKLAVGPESAGLVDVAAPVADNLKVVAKAKGERVRDVTAVVLDRPRHADLLAEIREAGARIRLIQDGDVIGVVSTAWPDAGADILFGVGGTPEGVLAAAAMKCMGGEIQGRLWPRDDDERRAALDAGYDFERVLRTDDLVSGQNAFFAATGITDGEVLKGVHYTAQGATTQSLVMRSRSGTVRRIDASHHTQKLQEFSSVDYG